VVERDGRDGSGREAFRPSGQVTGWVCVALAVAVAGLVVVEHGRGVPLWPAAAAVTFGALSWAVLLRPRVALVDGSLELRGSFDTVWVPLADIEMVAVGRVLAVSTEERRWTSAALGRSARRARRDDEAAAASRSGLAGQTSVSYAAVVERRLQDAVVEAVQREERAARAARRRPGSADAPDVTDVGPAADHVVRRPAWPEIVVTAAAAVATLVLLLA